MAVRINQIESGMAELLNRIQSPLNCHVPIYHATYPNVPPELVDGLHNVTPRSFKQQIEWYTRHFDIVPVDTLFLDKNPAGKVSITFDDAYQSIFDFALPILIEMRVPSTVFIIGGSLMGKVFWRDKIRFLINNGMTKNFIRYFGDRKSPFNSENFYKDSKKPNFNSRLIDQKLDSYLKENYLSNHNPIDNYLINDRRNIIRHPLICYGNHTFNHYVMPSLSSKEQYNEIKMTEDLLDDLELNRSRIFALPFGGPHYIDTTTLNTINQFNFHGVLLNGKCIHRGKIKHFNNNFPFVWRYIAPTDMSNFHKKILSFGISPLRKSQPHSSVIN
jgi:peptidoglycan/xylan/chitin deacetylase (PgdA/CDA1 family)